MLSGEVQVDYEVAAAATTWRRIVLAAMVFILVGHRPRRGRPARRWASAVLSAGRHRRRPSFGLIIGLFAFRATQGRPGFPAAEAARRERGRATAPGPLPDGSRAPPGRIGQRRPAPRPEPAGSASAEDLLAREEAHVAAIDELNARLEGSSAGIRSISLAASRDAAAREAADKAARAGRPRRRRRAQPAPASGSTPRSRPRRPRSTARGRRGPGPDPGRRQPGRRRTARRRGPERLVDVARAARRPPATNPGQRGRAGRPRARHRDDDGRATRYLEQADDRRRGQDHRRALPPGPDRRRDAGHLGRRPREGRLGRRPRAVRRDARPDLPRRSARPDPLRHRRRAARRSSSTIRSSPSTTPRRAGLRPAARA